MEVSFLINPEIMDIPQMSVQAILNVSVSLILINWFWPIFQRFLLWLFRAISQAFKKLKIFVDCALERLHNYEKVEVSFFVSLSITLVNFNPLFHKDQIIDQRIIYDSETTARVDPRLDAKDHSEIILPSLLVNDSRFEENEIWDVYFDC